MPVLLFGVDLLISHSAWLSAPCSCWWFWQETEAGVAGWVSGFTWCRSCGCFKQQVVAGLVGQVRSSCSYDESAVTAAEKGRKGERMQPTASCLGTSEG